MFCENRRVFVHDEVHVVDGVYVYDWVLGGGGGASSTFWTLNPRIQPSFDLKKVFVVDPCSLMSKCKVYVSVPGVRENRVSVDVGDT
jgi:hypothetical protein